MIRYAAEHYEPRYSPARDPQFLLDLPHAACRPRSAPDMRSRMRSPSHAPSFCLGKPVWLPRIPTSCPNTAKAPCVCTLPARSEAWNRPSRARFRPAAAAGASRRYPGAAQPRLRGPVTPSARTRVRRPVAPPGALRENTQCGDCRELLVEKQKFSHENFSKLPVPSRWCTAAT